MAKRWNYSGDINLEHGGLFWREAGSADYVEAVRVMPCSDAGGPDNLFHVEAGSIYMPQEPAKVAAALSCMGMTIGKRGRLHTGQGCPGLTGRAKLGALVEAWNAYHGMDKDAETVIRIGPAEDCSASGWSPEPDMTFRAGSHLERIVRREFLQG